MCDPLTATALTLSAGGSYLEQRDAKKNAKRVQNAKNSAYETGILRQRQYQDEAGQAFSENIDKQGRENFDEQKESEGQKFKQAFSDLRTTPDYNQGLTASAPKNVVLARQSASDEATTETNRDLLGLANLQGYGGALFNQGLDRNQFGRMFGNIQDQASRDSNLINLDVQAAGNNANKAPSLFPTLLKTAGTALSIYGAANPGTVTGGTAADPLKNAAGQNVGTYQRPFGSQIGGM